MSKLGIVLGAGVGYVLGARAGRERYDQLKQQAQRAWSDPRVQQKKNEAQHLAAQKAGDAQHKVQEKVQEKVDEVRSSSSTGSSTGSSASAEAGSPAGGTS